MNNKRDAELSDYVFGKVQPQVLPLEEAVLGAILLDNSVIESVADILKPGDFYDIRHQLIYTAIVEMYAKSIPIDMLTVMEKLRASGKLDEIGSGYYIVELTNRVASSANVEYHAHIVRAKSVQRQLIAVGLSIVKDGYEETMPVQDLIETAEKGIFAITNQGGTKQAVSAGSIAASVLKRIDEARNKKDGLVGVPSGLETIDRMTGGWQEPDLIVLAARPSMGKTALAVKFMISAAKRGFPVCFFSLEMSSEQLMNRVLSSEARIDGNRMNRGLVSTAEMEKIVRSAEIVSELPFFIDDTAGLSIVEARSRCRRMKTQHGIKLFVFDYLQLMSGERQKGDTREREVASISAALKGIAKELGVPVIALSQLSRASETRGGSKRPQLSDLRDSGSVEQDLDICMFIHRPEYYGIMEDESGNSLKGVAEIIFAKHRNGGVGTEEVKFEAIFTDFSDNGDPDFAGYPTPPPRSAITVAPSDDDTEIIPF